MRIWEHQLANMTPVMKRIEGGLHPPENTNTLC